MTNLIATFVVTAYCSCSVCCSRSSKLTASGVRPTINRTIAAPRSIPFGSTIYFLDSSLSPRIVEDRLARRFDNRLDVFMLEHKEARKFGKRKLKVRISRSIEHEN